MKQARLNTILSATVPLSSQAERNRLGDYLRFECSRKQLFSKEAPLLSSESPQLVCRLIGQQHVDPQSSLSK